MSHFCRLTLISALFLSTAALAQEAQVTPAPDIIEETFDGDDTSLMLGGQIDLTPNKNSPWALYVADGKLVMENRQNPASLTYNDITWVKFPSSTVLQSTEGLIIGALVEAQGSETHGGGILIGSGKRGHYLMFSVDGNGRYHILRKDGRKLRPVHSAIDPAVATDGPNELTFQFKGAHIAFFVNGTEVIQIPNTLVHHNARPTHIHAGVGLAAFGLGKFSFDRVEITKPN